MYNSRRDATERLTSDLSASFEWYKVNFESAAVLFALLMTECLLPYHVILRLHLFESPQRFTHFGIMYSQVIIFSSHWLWIRQAVSFYCKYTGLRLTSRWKGKLQTQRWNPVRTCSILFFGNVLGLHKPHLQTLNIVRTLETIKLNDIKVSCINFT